MFPEYCLLLQSQVPRKSGFSSPSPWASLIAAFQFLEVFVPSSLGNCNCCSLHLGSISTGDFLPGSLESFPLSCLLREVSWPQCLKSSSYPIPVHTCNAHHHLSQSAIYFLFFRKPKLCFLGTGLSLPLDCKLHELGEDYICLIHHGSSSPILTLDIKWVLNTYLWMN